MTAFARHPLIVAAVAALMGPSAAALPPVQPDPAALQVLGEPVPSIPTADEVRDFELLDEGHVLLSTGEEKRYLITLEPDCLGLRFARHVGVTTSDNTIWAGFDSLTADGEACSIREIHLMRRPLNSSAGG